MMMITSVLDWQNTRIGTVFRLEVAEERVGPRSPEAWRSCSSPWRSRPRNEPYVPERVQSSGDEPMESPLAQQVMLVKPMFGEREQPPPGRPPLAGRVALRLDQAGEDGSWRVAAWIPAAPRVGPHPCPRKESCAPMRPSSILFFLGAPPVGPFSAALNPLPAANPLKPTTQGLRLPVLGHVEASRGIREPPKALTVSAHSSSAVFANNRPWPSLGPRPVGRKTSFSYLASGAVCDTAIDRERETVSYQLRREDLGTPLVHARSYAC